MFEIKLLFDNFDEDKNGIITREEFLNVILKIKRA